MKISQILLRGRRRKRERERERERIIDELYNSSSFVGNIIIHDFFSCCSCYSSYSSTEYGLGYFDWTWNIFFLPLSSLIYIFFSDATLPVLPWRIENETKKRETKRKKREQTKERVATEPISLPEFVHYLLRWGDMRERERERERRTSITSLFFALVSILPCKRESCGV